ncbi:MULTISPECIES: methyl-accepting chemotaxis protein [Pseudomonas]|uniref:Methyl-accepting chemotaxis protein n=4 Tax=Pseudomonas TaxID=286 RepID=A0A7Y7WUN0_9PSED|nr:MULTISPECIES: methyl-accepting chemotaxis protein [Pseudomonas]MPQ67026.1 HAMP domain-containing protein [Pseudomonas sp. MWU12-2323]NWB88031.1 methyl-accepting chemotaxis protein [Pseudomonas gingeri]
MFRWLTRALRDRSIRFKLALGFGLVLLLTLAITLTGWHALSTTVERSHTLSSIARLSRLTSDMRADRIAFRVLNDPQSRTRITRQLASIEKLLTTLLPRLTDPGERQILADQQHAAQGFQTTLDDLDENLRDRDRARKRMNAGLTQATQAVARFAAHQLREAGKSPHEQQWQAPLKRVEELRQLLNETHASVQTPAYLADSLQAYSEQALKAIDRLGQLETQVTPLTAPLADDYQRMLLELRHYREALQRFKDAQLLTEAAHNVMEGLGNQLLAGNEDLSRSQTQARDRQTQAAKWLLAKIALLAWLIATLAAWVLSRQLLIPLSRSLKLAHHIAAGDLSRDVAVDRQDELGQLQQAMRGMTLGLRELIRGIGISASRVASAAEHLSTSTEQTDASVSSQYAATEQVAAAMKQMSASVLEVARHAETASVAATQADQQAREGDSAVADAIEQIEQLEQYMQRCSQAMGGLQRESERIGSVLDVIKSVSQQTNLLALNAAIEAARAGEAGSGFAVVADEVRCLAQRTQDSAQEIKDLIVALQGGTQEVAGMLDNSRKLTRHSVESSRHSGGKLEAISRSVSQILGMNEQIAAAGEEQSVVAEQISRSMLHVRDMSQQTANACDETAAASLQLSQLGAQLQRLVERFKV